jgi:release factor glutamine methyltransferase
VAAIKPGAALSSVLVDLTARLRDVGIESAARDARLLGAAALNASPEDLLRDGARVLTDAERLTLEAYAQRRARHEPVSRILGSRGFYGRMFEITPATLDPRPDTETVIDAVLEIARDRSLFERPIRILDIGTGSGCLLITVLAALPQATGIGVDISAAALDVAKRNAAALGVADRAHFVIGKNLDGQTQPFDLVVSNPPYIPTADIASLDSDVRDFDPSIALDGGVDGLDVYRAIARQLTNVLVDGAIVVEVGAGQATVVAKLFSDALGPLGQSPRLWSDLGGHQRCVAVETQRQQRRPKNL